MKALLIIAPRNFRDEEYFHTKEELEKAGIGTTTASVSTNTATGMLGGTAMPDITLGDVDVDEYDAILFIGGSGASIYFDDPAAHEIARRAEADGKILGAICIAPSTLANAGLLKGRKVTAYSSEESNLRARGAEFTGDGVTVDGDIITASGPQSAREFGRAVARALG